MDKVITCSEKGTEPSTALVATFPAMVFASVSRMILQNKTQIVSVHSKKINKFVAG